MELRLALVRSRSSVSYTRRTLAKNKKHSGGSQHSYQESWRSFSQWGNWRTPFVESRLNGFTACSGVSSRPSYRRVSSVEWGKKIVHIIYLDDGKGVKACFEDGTEVTGFMLAGADGARLWVRSLLVGSDVAKPTPIDFAASVYLKTCSRRSRQRALFLRSEPHHPLSQIVPHPDGYYSWLGLHDASDSKHPENWEFFQYISFPEPRELENNQAVAEHVAHLEAMAARFADPWRSSFEWMPDDIMTAWDAKLSHGSSATGA